MTTPPPPGSGDPNPYQSQQPYGQQPYGQQPYPYPPQPPQKKRKIWPWILGGVILVFVLIIGGCVALVGTAANEVDKQSKKEVEVTYRVSGTGTASITWTDKDFNIAQATNVTLPWEKKVTVTGFAKAASLTVTNNESDTASTKCEIIVGDQVKYTQTATGPYASATCTGSVD